MKWTGCISEILSHRRWPVVTTQPTKTATQWPLPCSHCAQFLLRTCTHPALPAPALPGPLRLLNKSLTFFKADNQKPFQAARGAAFWLGLHFTSSLGQILTIIMHVIFHRLQLSRWLYFSYSWVAALYGSRWKESFHWTIREQFCCVLLTLLFCTHQSRAQPSGTSSLGVEGLSSHAGLEEAKAAQGFQTEAVSQGPHVDWEVQLLSQRNWKKK